MRFVRRAAIPLTTLLLFDAALHVWNPLPAALRRDRVGLEPHARITIHNPDDPKLDRVVTQVRNSLGFRGPEVPADFAKRLSIVTVGGSTTECMLLPDEKTWPAVMASALAKQLPVWVNNAGVDGSATISHLILLESRLIPLHPDVVLFLIGYNDIGLSPGWTSTAGNVWRELGRYSEIARLSLNMVRAWRARPAHYDEEATIDLAHVAHKSVSREQIAALVASHAPYLAAYRERLAALVDRSRGAGIQPVLITQPMLPGELSDPTTGVDLSTVVEKDGPDLNGAEAWALMERYNDETRHLAATRSVQLIDLARLLPKDSRLFIDFVHYSNEGAAAVGQIVAGELAARLNDYDGV